MRLFHLRARRALLLALACTTTASAQLPQALDPGVTVRAVLTGLPSPLRLDVEPGSRALLILTFDGRVHRLAAPYVGQPLEVIATPTQHGLTGVVQGMAVGPDGALYLVANRIEGALTTGLIRRGRVSTVGGRVWETVAQTEPYPRSNTPYDHSLSGVVVSPDGRWLFINSGSRTDHGEVQSNGGLFSGVREVPLTSAILRVPAGATDLLLRNDEAFLRAGGYLYADGVRNSFDLAFDAAGRLFGTENAGDRDDPEELNWLREGRHYGFPWRMGLNDTPMQFPGYDPARDRLLNPASSAVQGGFFYNDPAYPAPPPGTVFTAPLLNRGPDANRIRDPDGTIRRAGEQPFGTFTTHRSPLGLVFDTARALPVAFQGDAFVLSWTGTESPLLSPFGDEGEDLLHLRLLPADAPAELRVTRLVRGFTNPIDAVLVAGSLFVVEFAEAATLWRVSFVPIDGNSVQPPAPAAGWHFALTPEPVTATARVQLTAPASQHVRVEVRALTGQLEALLFEGTLNGNEPHTLTLSRAGLAAGVHLLRVVGAYGAYARPFVVR